MQIFFFIAMTFVCVSVVTLDIHILHFFASILWYANPCAFLWAALFPWFPALWSSPPHSTSFSSKLFLTSFHTEKDDARHFDTQHEILHVGVRSCFVKGLNLQSRKQLLCPPVLNGWLDFCLRRGFRRWLFWCATNNTPRRYSWLHCHTHWWSTSFSPCQHQYSSGPTSQPSLHWIGRSTLEA